MGLWYNCLMIKKVIKILFLLLVISLGLTVATEILFQKDGGLQVIDVPINKESIKTEDDFNLEDSELADGFFVVEIREKINPDKNSFLFRVHGKEKDDFLYGAERISVFEITNNEMRFVQEIVLEETSTYDREKLGIIIEDMNFDGYKDLRIQSFISAGVNTPFYYWLWDDELSQYKRSEELEKIISPEFDSEKETISSFVRIGAGNYLVREYKYIEGEIVLSKEEEIFYDN